MKRWSRNRVYLSLGSNIDPTFHLPAAVRLLAERGRLRALSRAWESTPYGYQDQADFVNAAVLLETELEAEQVIEELIPLIERKLNRRRDPSNKNGPRTIDIDLSLYNHEVGEVRGRTIPDPTILQRLFVAGPLAELDPGFRHPLTGETLLQIADRLAEIHPPLRLRAEVVLAPAGWSNFAVS